MVHIKNNHTMKFINNLLDNRYAQKIFLPLAIINTFKSYSKTKKEFNILKQIIDENDLFFKSIVTLGFSPTKGTFCLTSVMPFEKELTLEQIQAIASKTIIGVILEYVKDENLLGIVHVDCKIEKQFVVTTIQPVSLKIYISDIFDLVFSLMANIIVVSSILLFQHYFFT